MSLKINIDKLNDKQRDKINDELRINLGSGASKYIFPYNIVNDDIFIPFAFAKLDIKSDASTPNTRCSRFCRSFNKNPSLDPISKTVDSR